MAKTTVPKLTKQPETEARAKGHGHEMQGLGKVGGHVNVVNPSSHADKLKSC